MRIPAGRTWLAQPEFVALHAPVLRLTYSRAKYAAAATLAPQRSADLITWHTTGITTEKLSEDAYRETWRATVPATAPRTFLRLIASP